MSFAAIITKHCRDKHLTDIVSNGDETGISGRNFKPLFNCGDGAIEVGICHRKYASNDAIKDHIRCLISKSK